ncbi:MAG: Hsp33 family molecular chaperone HslO [Granulosicoccus sp.]|nr:Hsp33 family molecular chaperone HslO [Granulosicoccus sp.]
MRDTDTRQKFLVESCDVRGHHVQLDHTWQEAVARTRYPPMIRQILGEAFAATALLASTIKFDGKMTLQLRGDGPVYLLVVQVTADGDMRGLARWNAEPEDVSLNGLFGSNARMSITVEANRHHAPYQGIVPLEGSSLAQSLQAYFRTSEQLPTQLFLAVSDDTAAGVLVQKLPADLRQANDSDGWQRATVLCDTLSDEELCLQDTSTLLHRLFHDERVRVFEAEPVRFHCSCSRERTDGMLIGLGSSEVADIVQEQGRVEITCEFCDRQYIYDAVDVAALFKGLPTGVVVPAAGDDDTDMTRH